jgi:predicted unusual protein kinase regulating ubiquinone biosynthesis (AarF/ABC1/UbiB family)
MNGLKRTLQYAGLSALGVGAKVVSQGKLKQAMKRTMATKMAGMKGIPLKMSQILGMGEAENAEMHRQAQLTIEPMPKEQICAIIQQTAPALFEDAELLPDFKCASLGQVNHLKANGGEFAIKIQYPESESNLDMDDKAFKLVTGTFGNFSKGFNMQDYRETLKNELRQELDYQREQEMQHEFFRIFTSQKDIIIPLAYTKFSSEKCLVMSWESSIGLEKFLAIATDDMKQQATKLFTEFYITSIFKHGLLHADPNPGNFGFRVLGERVQLVVYDFGSVVKLEHRKHMDLLALFKMTTDKQNPLAALLALGFDVDLLLPLKSKLPAMMMILLEPFITEQKFQFSKWQRQERIADVLGDDRWNFMVAAPAELFLFMRSLSGLFYYSEKLTGSLYVQPLLTKVYSTCREELSQATSVFLRDFPEEEGLSENMIISVKENGLQKVKLTLPARAIENLSTLIPPDVTETLERQKIDLATLVKVVRQNAYRAQEVFELIDGNKTISVYLK